MKMLAMALMVGAMSMPVMAQEARFESFPTVKGEYDEMYINGNQTDFSLWSPEAEEVELLLYANENTVTPFKTLMLTRQPDGRWKGSVSGNLIGKFYTFRVKHNGKWLAETPGIWAKAAGTNGQAMRSSSSELIPTGEMRLTEKVPLVMVPVLSNRMVFTLESASR